MRKDQDFPIDNSTDPQELLRSIEPHPGGPLLIDPILFDGLQYLPEGYMRFVWGGFMLQVQPLPSSLLLEHLWRVVLVRRTLRQNRVPRNAYRVNATIGKTRAGAPCLREKVRKAPERALVVIPLEGVKLHDVIVLAQDKRNQSQLLHINPASKVIEDTYTHTFTSMCQVAMY